MTGEEDGGKACDKVIPSTYDIYCLKDGLWSLHSCFLHEEKDGALAEAMRLDQEGGFDGVRLMGVKFGASGHGAIEVMVWVSPGLQDSMFKPERPAAARRASKARRSAKELPKEAASKQEGVDGEDPGEADQVRQAVSRQMISGKQPPGKDAIAMDKERRLMMGPSDEIMAGNQAPEPFVAAPPGGNGKEGEKPSAANEHIQALTVFMNRIGKVIGGWTKFRNAHEMFGLDLFLAGACEGYGLERNLSEGEVTLLIRDIAAAAGGEPKTATIFASKLQDYRGSARYRSMIESGRRTIAMAAKNESLAFKELALSLQNWNSSIAAASQAQGIVTIMFTDIVDSTRMTQEKGDFGAQEVIHTHNAIVRDAIAAQHGHEVKHTGDGIMACFPLAGNAVDAALMIHCGIAKHNAGHEAPKFEVRIGLNSGDPIREENDYFGAPVQIAARVCAKAGGGQTMVTGPVRDLAAAHGVHFREAGKFQLKGIGHDIMLYEAVQEDGGLEHINHDML